MLSSSGCFGFRCTERMLAAHLAADTLLRQGSLVVAMNPGVFLVILDLVAALFNALIDILLATGFRLVATPADSEKQHRIFPGVEVLMKPHLRRHEYAAGLPIDSLDRLAFLPHQRIAVSFQDHNVDSRPVAVGLFLG